MRTFGNCDYHVGRSVSSPTRRGQRPRRCGASSCDRRNSCAPTSSFPGGSSTAGPPGRTASTSAAPCAPRRSHPVRRRARPSPSSTATVRRGAPAMSDEWRESAHRSSRWPAAPVRLWNAPAGPPPLAVRRTVRPRPPSGRRAGPALRLRFRLAGRRVRRRVGARPGDADRPRSQPARRRTPDPR